MASQSRSIVGGSRCKVVRVLDLRSRGCRFIPRLAALLGFPGSGRLNKLSLQNIDVDSELFQEKKYFIRQIKHTVAFMD